MSSANEIMTRMQKLQEKRESSFKPLASIMGQRESVREEIARLIKEQEKRIAELEGPYRSAFNGAIAGGWSAEELKALGADEPARRGRPKVSRTRSPKKNPQQSPPETAKDDAEPATDQPSPEQTPAAEGTPEESHSA
ncbi:hypothetical protein ABZW38_16860 [Streptomyces bacillaris]|uniref:hypothetical protein n=1 Tax=Streptomyces bacillaris TaxID=68179 RepID=UPI00345F993F